MLLSGIIQGMRTGLKGVRAQVSVVKGRTKAGGMMFNTIECCAKWTDYSGLNDEEQSPVKSTGAEYSFFVAHAAVEVVL